MLAIIQARVSSKRFPDKVLKKINKQTVLEQVINQANAVFPLKKIIVATSRGKKDLKICKICKKKGVKYFRGDLNNVSKRFYNILNKYNSKSFIRICADSPFLDPILVKKFIKIFKRNELDFITNVLPRTFPRGQSIEIFNSDIYKSNFKKIRKASDLEHVTTFFYSNKKKFKYLNIKNRKNFSDISMCIDYPDQLLNAKNIFQKNKIRKTFKNWKKYITYFKRIKY
tara:strand:+ start:5087 stop:5767 length:681 start_codon:yes stop_codon:yes gene_type:complete